LQLTLILPKGNFEQIKQVNIIPKLKMRVPFKTFLQYHNSHCKAIPEMTNFGILFIRTVITKLNSISMFKKVGDRKSQVKTKSQSVVKQSYTLSTTGKAYDSRPFAKRWSCPLVTHSY
jgi:hypothetical protein